MARRRRRRSTRRIWIVGIIATIAGVWTYARLVSPVLEGDDGNSNSKYVAATGNDRQTGVPIPQLTSTRPESTGTVPDGNVAEKGKNDTLARVDRQDPAAARRARDLFAVGMRELEGGDLLAARSHLSEALGTGLSQQERLDARAALARIGMQTIFGSAIIRDDPFVRRHIIAPGESLGKIAKKYNVTADFLAKINRIPNKNRIRAGQTIKVVLGPFHARISKETFRMDIYLHDTYVKHYPVGIGADDSTPSGTWKVGTKLINPTYYPPRGGAIVAADDPENPLGEHWIELIGVAGGAVGQERYGIHGTNDPTTIERSESLGCIRMHNADVEELYAILVPQKSGVIVD